MPRAAAVVGRRAGAGRVGVGCRRARRPARWVGRALPARAACVGSGGREPVGRGPTRRRLGRPQPGGAPARRDPVGLREPARRHRAPRGHRQAHRAARRHAGLPRRGLLAGHRQPHGHPVGGRGGLRCALRRSRPPVPRGRARQPHPLRRRSGAGPAATADRPTATLRRGRTGTRPACTGHPPTRARRTTGRAFNTGARGPGTRQRTTRARHRTTRACRARQGPAAGLPRRRHRFTNRTAREAVRPGFVATAWAGGATGCRPPDPTGSGCLTGATRHGLDAVGAAFGGWQNGPVVHTAGCWDRHAWNPSSDHSRGQGLRLHGHQARHLRDGPPSATTAGRSPNGCAPTPPRCR